MAGLDTTAARRTAHIAAATIAAAAAIAASGCGADAEPQGADTADQRVGTADTAGQRTGAADTTAASTTRDGEPTNGELTTTTGEVIRDWGSRALRRGAVADFLALQDEFREGRMDAACKRIDDFMLDQFSPAGTSPGSPCPKKLEAYAGLLAQRDPLPPLRLLWVRAYTSEAGLWVEDTGGRRLRIPLWDEFDGSGWKVKIGVTNRPGVIARKLDRAASYARK